MSHRSKKRDNTRVYTGFFAYPSTPSDRGEIIEKAIQVVNSSGRGLHIRSWRSMERSSARIITNIIESIRKCDIFFADISGLNPNVLFEVGYAFGKEKRVVLLTQGFSSEERQQDLRDIEILSGLEIGTYQNSDELASYMLHRSSFFDTTDPELKKYLVLVDGSRPGKPLFLKGPANHEIARTALRVFKERFPQTLVDDWTENSAQTFLWYLRAVGSASQVLALFINPSWDQGRQANARFAFICGLAVAFGKPVRMLGLPGFETPFDYRDLLVRVSNVAAAENAVLDLARTTDADIPSDAILAPLAQTASVEPKVDKQLVLLEVNLGNPVAENEEDELSDYFIPTGQYTRALNCKQAIIVGTKGSGKTANFFQVRNYFLQQHPKNLVCEIKPADYRMEQFLVALRHLEEHEGAVGHVLESVWKLILYSYMLQAMDAKVQNKPLAAGRSRQELELAEFVDRHRKLIDSPFERKLDIASKWLQETGYDGDNFSKRIHDAFLSEAIRVLRDGLRFVHSVIVLIDNLDKAWSVGSDLQLQARVIFSLLGIHRRLRGDFGKDVDIRVLIFVRRNIYEYCLDVAREPDKIIADTIELTWNDKEMLLRVLEQRFNRAIASQRGNLSQTPWTSFLCPAIEDRPTADWLYDSVIRRPRDLILFVQTAIEWAVNRNHSEILEADLFSAREKYSSFALDELVSEYKAEEPWLPDALRSFRGGYSVVTYQEVISHLKSLRLAASPKKTPEEMLVVLVRIGFLGVGFDEGDVRFANDLNESRVLVSLVTTMSGNRELVFQVNPVFWEHLKVRHGRARRSEPMAGVSPSPRIGLLSILRNMLKGIRRNN